MVVEKIGTIEIPVIVKFITIEGSARGTLVLFPTELFLSIYKLHF